MNKQFDFTFQKFNEILDCLRDNGYTFQSLEDYLRDPHEKVVILRHDVDRSPLHSLKTAKLENSKGIRGTYYFRVVRQSNHPEVIRSIAALGHEIGYHYEDLSFAWAKLRAQGTGHRAKGTGLRAQGSGHRAHVSSVALAKEEGTGGRVQLEELERQVAEVGIEFFKKNLEEFRKIVPVHTICMHGSPMSRWDSRILWKYYDYHDSGIIGEPYFDLDFNNVLYLTDTGRKWNGDRSSVRDKVFQEKFLELKGRLKNSDDILASVSANELPQHLMITVHPQRWSDNLFKWMWEYGTQKMKNNIKRLIFVR